MDIKLHSDLRTKLNTYKYLKYKNMVDQYEADDEQEERILDSKCRACYYLERNMAFQAFTESICRNCGKPLHFPSSDINDLCLDCADTLNLCIHCGGQMD